ncbi:MAG TPA: flagellar basal body rod protein FlgC, partial [Blastocatellia bacterium]|nr:flagellar basal body rod protein FlgC [Blastocatellia bacterium]
RARLEVVASNLANSNTTRTPEGGPYKRRDVVFSVTDIGSEFSSELDRAAKGVEINEIRPDNSPPVRQYNPGHPDADAQGYVLMPNINPIEETVNMMGATRAYQSNLTVFNSVKDMVRSTIDMLKS